MHHTWKKYLKNRSKTNWKYQLQEGMKNLIYVISISDIQDYFEYILKRKHGEKTDNLSVRMYINKIESRIIFKIKTWYDLELVMPETLKSLESTKTR